MGKINDKEINARIIEQALNLGASVAGIANVDALKNSPSHFVFGKCEFACPVGKVEWASKN